MLGSNALAVAAVDLVRSTTLALGLVCLVHAVQVAIAHVLLRQTTVLVALEPIALGMRGGSHHLANLIQTHAVLGTRKVLEEFAVQVLGQTQSENVEEEATAAHRLRTEGLARWHGGPKRICDHHYLIKGKS